MRRFVLALLVLLLPNLALGQATVLQGGTWAPGQVPTYSTSGSSQPTVQSAGPAGGGGVGINEIAVIARGTGAAPHVAQGSGPLGTNICDYDGPTNSAAGYHFLCFSANAQGGGLITYGKGGAATALPLNMVINGVTYAFPFALSGVIGPSPTTVGRIPTWNNATGTLLANGIAGGTATLDGSLSMTGNFTQAGTTWSMAGGFFVNSALPLNAYADFSVPTNGTTYVDNVLTLQNKSINNTSHYGNAAIRMIDQHDIERAAFGYSCALTDLCAFTGNTAYVELSNLNGDAQYTNFALASTHQGLTTGSYFAWFFNGTTGHSFFADHLGRNFMEVDPEANYLTLYGPAAGNNIQFHPGAAAAPVTVTATGNDPTVLLRLDDKAGAGVALASNGNYALYAQNVSASAVNYLKALGSATGNPVELSANGTDGTILFRVTDKAGAGVALVSNGNYAVIAQNASASAVNYLRASGSATGGNVALAATGTDPNISLELTAKATGAVNLISRAAAVAVFSNPASPVNYLGVTGGATGASVTLSAQGGDADVILALSPRGAGTLQVNGSNSWAANGAVATAMTNVGPVGSHTTVQEWFVVRNASGVLRYIPGF